MQAVVKILAIFYIAFGITTALKPDLLRKYVRFWREPKRFYAGGAAGLAVVLVLLTAAPGCQWPVFIYIFGGIGLLKVLAIFFLGPRKFFPVFDGLEQKGPSAYRSAGLLTIVLGVLLFLAA